MWSYFCYSIFMQELWQLYDEQGQPLANKGAVRSDVFSKGLLHGASHVWIWRHINQTPQILLQKRSATKETWPNLFDISAAGHIDVNEDPLTAAIRETHEEIGLAVTEADLNFIGVEKIYMTDGNGKIENEFQWIYLYEINSNVEFKLHEDEVASLEWQNIENFKTRLVSRSQNYVPHGDKYFSTVIDAIETRIASSSNHI